MQSTDYQKDVNESGRLIYTTEQWFRSLQGRKMDCDRVTKPLSNSSEKIPLSNDFYNMVDISKNAVFPL